MKAMLRCDFLTLRQQFKTLALMLLFFLLMAIITQSVAFLGTVFLMLCLILPFNLLASDAASGWDRLTLAMPISRRAVIGSKYLLCLGTTLLLLVLSLVAGVLSTLQVPDASLALTSAGFLICAATSLLLLAILMPTILKFGAQSARYIVIAIVWIPILLGFLASQMGIGLPGALADMLINPAPLTLLPIAFVALIIALVLYALSFLVGSAIYQKKEF